MNKTDKLVAALLGLLLAGYVWHSFNESKKASEAQAQYLRDLAEWEKAHPEEVAREKAAAAAKEKAAAPAQTSEARPSVPAKAEKPRPPERLVTLTNAQGKAAFVFSTRGAALKSATLFEFATRAGERGEDNPPLSLDFSSAPALALDGVDGLAPDADWSVKELTATGVVFAAGTVTRRISVLDDYRIGVEEDFGGARAAAATKLSLGVMQRGSKDGILSIDSMLLEGEKPGVRHWDEEAPLQGYLSSGVSGGCSCSGSNAAALLSPTATQSVPGASKWIAVKNGYFVSALFGCSENPSGFTATVARDVSAKEYAPQSVAAAAEFKTLGAKRSYTLYVGPKRQSLLWDLGLQDVMEFGMWRWLCYGLVWVLNLFYAMIPNYGVAIILLTVLVRLVFWPLTHKSTIGMRKMQEIQPLMKELQAKYKGNPQRLQQETWQLYREHKVNPLSSCLPMIVQIPVFFALFVVLRGAVELRFAPFLWIKDLSQPEALGAASWFPFFGGLNILPILMAATMALQSALTPSAGDQRQQRMMMVFMPIMMLVMFYNFASALSLYWTLSQVLSIAQMWWIRKKYGTPAGKKAVKDGVTVPDAVEMPQTRQMRRHHS